MTLVNETQILEQLQLAEMLRTGREQMEQPQDLPGRYGRVIRSLDRLLQAVACSAVVGGGWAVWRHGYIGRVTQDVDIVVGANDIEQMLRAAPVCGFDVLPVPRGRWPKLVHRETGITVDILPEGERPGTASHPAPTTLPHPVKIGAQSPGSLSYITLPGLIELKLAAGRARDESDVVELILANFSQIEKIQQHLAAVHPSYQERFAALLSRAREESAE